MVKLALCGASGRMGKAITEVVQESIDCQITYPIDNKEDSLFASIGKAIRLSDVIDTLDLDVVVDFTPPDSVLYHLKLAVENNKPFVTGTTGFTEAQWNEFNRLASLGKVFYSANYSLGVFILQSLVKHAAELMRDGYDVEMIDFHHNKKVDSPSGTALKLAETLTSVYNERSLVHGRPFGHQPRKVEDITIHALRGGDVVGDHTVIFAGNGERIEVSHKAISRKTFAAGVVEAAKFLVKCDKNRLYGMEDLFNKSL